MSANEVAARVAACKVKAEALLADLEGLIGDLPEWREEAEGKEEVLINVRMELEEAVNWPESMIDYLTPRSDDDEPECCAHRRLQTLIGAKEAQT